MTGELLLVVSAYAQGTGNPIRVLVRVRFEKSLVVPDLVDDPHKASEASSDTIRGNVIEWFQTH